MCINRGWALSVALSHNKKSASISQKRARKLLHRQRRFIPKDPKCSLICTVPPLPSPSVKLIAVSAGEPLHLGKPNTKTSPFMNKTDVPWILPDSLLRFKFLCDQTDV